MSNGVGEALEILFLALIGMPAIPPILAGAFYDACTKMAEGSSAAYCIFIHPFWFWIIEIATVIVAILVIYSFVSSKTQGLF